MEALSARIRNALRNLSLFSNFLLHYHFVLSFFIHRQHFHFCHHCKSNVHYPIPVGAAACPARYPDFLHFHKQRQPHHHRHSSLSLAPHYQKSKFAPQVKQGCFNSGRTKSLHGRSDTNDRRRNHNSSFFIIHFSSFILTHRRQPRTITRPALPPFFIFHLSKHHPLPSLRPSYQLLSLTF